MIRAQLEHTFIETNQIRLHAVCAGPVEGPLVVLLHGFPEFWWGWSKQIDALADAGYRLVIPDQRGYNLSDKPEGVAAYRLGTLAKDVLGIIHASGRKEAAVIGHDWGAAVAWQLGVQSPAVVSKLGILNVPFPPVMAKTIRTNLRQVMKSLYIFFFQIPKFPEILLGVKDYAGLATLLARSGKRNTFQREDLARYRVAWSQPRALTGMLNWYRASFRAGIKSPTFGTFPAGSRILLPTLILWGARDVALQRAMARDSLQHCDQGKLIYFENATHWVQHDEPAAVNAHLLRFLKEAPK